MSLIGAIFGTKTVFMSESKNRHIKVLHITEDLKIGGLEKVIFNLVTKIDANRFNSFVWCLSGGGQVAEQIKENGISLEILNIKNYKNPQEWLRLYTRLKALNVDILHVHGYFASFPSRVAAQLIRIPVVIHHFHTMYNSEVLTIKHRMADCILNRYFTDRCIAVSEAVKKSFVEKEGLNPKIIEVIYNGIDGKKFCFSEPQYNGVFAIIASLTRHKGHEILLRAFKKISHEIPHAKLWVIGDGPLREELQQKSNDLGLNKRVIFKGLIDKVENLLRDVDFTIIASTREGLPLSVIEAMASGRPVIGSNTGGIPEAINHGENGFLFPPTDVDALAHCIAQLLNNRNLLEKMGMNGHKIFLEKFTLNKMINEFEDLYLRCGLS